MANNCPKILRSFANNMAFIGNIVRLAFCNKTKSQNEWTDLCWRKQGAWCWRPTCQKIYVQKEWTQQYFYNCSPTRSNLGFTPKESYSGKKLDLSYLHIFGCTAFVHIVKEDKNKLEPKSCKGVLVGYDEVTQGYCCFLYLKNERC